MRVLVTGPTGFLGSHLIERLCAAGHPVRALLYGPTHPVLARLDVEVAPGDITAPETLAGSMAGIDAVIHTAALVSNWGPWPLFQKVTVDGTENLLRAAADAGVRRFVHVSTIRVYDDRYCLRQRVVREDAPHGDCGFRAFGHYARAKVLAEQAVWRWRHRIPVTVVRPAWPYGPRDVSILPALMRFMKSPGARWPSRQDPCADAIYVTDVADCLIAAATCPGAVGQAYNAAPAGRVSLREFLGAVGLAMGINLPGRSLPLALSATVASCSEWWARLTNRSAAPPISRAGVAILAADVRHLPDKAIRELGWRPQVELAEGVRATVAWLRGAYPEFA